MMEKLGAEAADQGWPVLAGMLEVAKVCVSRVLSNSTIVLLK